MAQLIGMASVLQNMRAPEPVPVNLPPPPPLEGALAPNNWLTKVERFATGVIGPRSMVVVNGYVYAVTKDSWVLEIMPNGTSRTILRMALASCGQPNAVEGACGMPTAIRADSQGFLIVADAYLGIFRISPRTGRYKLLVDARTTRVNNKPIGFIGDLTVAREGIVVFTSSSTRWKPSQANNIIIEGDRSGRVLIYNPRATLAQDRVKEIMADLSYPDGLQLAQDESYFLVGASTKIYRVFLGPPKHGTIEVFTDNLPGFVNNIRLSPRQTYWVGLRYPRHRDLPSILDTRGANTQENLKYRSELILRPQDQAAMMSPKFGIAVEIDLNGNEVRSVQDPTGAVYRSVSEIAEEVDVLYVASPDNNFIGLLNVHWLPDPYTPPPGLPPPMTPPPTTPRPITTAPPNAPSTTPSPIPTTSDPHAAELEVLMATVKANMKKLTDSQVMDVVIQLARKYLETRNVIYKAQGRASRLERDLQALQMMTDTSGLSAEQKQLIRDSWAAFTAGPHVETDVIQMFVKLFNTTPEAATLFSFVPADGLSEQALLNNTRLRAHAQRVAGALGSAVNSLDSIPTLAALTKDLGARHASYGVQERFFQPFMEGLLYALEKKVGSQFTADTRHAWAMAFALIVNNMKKGLTEGRAVAQG